MSDYTGYKGDSLTFLQNYKVKVGDSIKVVEDLTYTGILMPRYEHGDDKHIVLKLKSGYNIGLELAQIQKVTKIQSDEKKIENKESFENSHLHVRVMLIM